MKAEITRLLSRIEEWTGFDGDRGSGGPVLERFAQSRAAALGVGVVDYLRALQSRRDEPELQRVLNAITVGHTWFFRDPEQIEQLRSILESRAASGPVDVWVPGCASGEDVWTVAMVARLSGCRVRILGTDLNTDSLERARGAVYSAWSLRNVPAPHRSFLEPAGATASRVRLAADVTFQIHNLADRAPAPPSGRGWDVILCRNVLIYFSRKRAARCIGELLHSLADDGWLLLGPTEAACAPKNAAHLHAGRIAFRRPAAASPAPAPSEPDPPRAAPPRDETADLRRGGEALDAGDYATALAVFGEILDRDPLCLEALLFAGIAHSLAGNLLESVQMLRSASFLDPELWPAAYYLATAYETLGQLDDARREYRRVVDAATRPLVFRPAGGSLEKLEAWKQELVALAARRERRLQPGDSS